MTRKTPKYKSQMEKWFTKKTKRNRDKKVRPINQVSSRRAGWKEQRKKRKGKNKNPVTGETRKDMQGVNYVYVGKGVTPSGWVKKVDYDIWKKSAEKKKK